MFAVAVAHLDGSDLCPGRQNLWHLPHLSVNSASGAADDGVI